MSSCYSFPLQYHDFDVYAFASLRCKQDLELIQLCYKEEGSEFLEEIVKEAWEKPDVLEWACTLPMDEIPVEHRDKLIALNKLRVVAKNTSIPDKGVKTPSRQNPATDQYPEGRFSDITSAHGQAITNTVIAIEIDLVSVEPVKYQPANVPIAIPAPLLFVVMLISPVPVPSEFAPNETVRILAT